MPGYKHAATVDDPRVDTCWYIQVDLAAEEVGEAKGSTDREHRQGHTFKCDRDPCDDCRCRTSQRRRCNLTHRTPRSCSVVLRDVDKGDTQDDASEAREAKPEPAGKAIVTSNLVAIEKEIAP